MADAMNTGEQWDKLLGDALRLVTAGIDPDVGSETVADAMAALRKQAKALKETEYSGSKSKLVTCPTCEKKFAVELPAYDLLAKTMAHTAKMIDETARLVQFMSGKADSRPDLAGLGGLEWLQVLTDEQVAQVQAWVRVQQQAQSA